MAHQRPFFPVPRGHPQNTYYEMERHLWLPKEAIFYEVDDSSRADTTSSNGEESDRSGPDRGPGFIALIKDPALWPAPGRTLWNTQDSQGRETLVDEEPGSSAPRWRSIYFYYKDIGWIWTMADIIPYDSENMQQVAVALRRWAEDVERRMESIHAERPRPAANAGVSQVEMFEMEDDPTLGMPNGPSLHGGPGLDFRRLTVSAGQDVRESEVARLFRGQSRRITPETQTNRYWNRARKSLRVTEVHAATI